MFMDCLEKSIRKISWEEFEKFISIKESLEYLMIKSIPIIVTTCKAAKSKIFDGIAFKRVIIDEATQSHELETLESILNADQVVLVGD